MTRCGVVELAAAQHTNAAGQVLLQDDAAQPAAPIVTVCTSASPVGQVAGASASTVPVECIKREFRVTEITGEEAGVPAGEAVLDERIQYLMAQQLPASAIPVCT